MANQDNTNQWSRTSRRRFISGAGLAAVSAPILAQAASDCEDKADRAKLIAAAPQAPFDSIRDYMAALDARGLLFRVEL